MNTSIDDIPNPFGALKLSNIVNTPSYPIIKNPLPANIYFDVDFNEIIDLIRNIKCNT